MTTRYVHTMPFGAEVRGDGVRFRLWAPAQTAPHVVVDPAGAARTLPMAPQGDGWFECVSDSARAGSRYRFRLDDGSMVPDPASRFQPEDVDGPSEVVDPRAYEWQTSDRRGRPWREMVLYELHVGAFAGDYAGVQHRLDHIARLGVTAVELMPLADFAGTRNWGYDGVLPFAPDSSYGTPDALKRLIDAAHGRGLAMFLDVVYNHFGPSGNYLDLYAPGFFTDRHHTPWGKAIDFSRREVRDYFIHNALYWLSEYRFDGLRFDAVDQIRDDSATPILEEIAATVRARIPDRQIHLVLENDNNAAHLLEREAGKPGRYNAQWNDDFHHVAHLLATAERDGYYTDYVERPVAKLGRALAEGFVYQGEHSAFRNHRRGVASSSLPPLAFVDFLQNHDQIGNRAFGERLARLADTRTTECLAAIWLLAPSIPLFFMGQEWASAQPFLFFCDFHGDLADAVREGRRREFGRFPAFADPAAQERIPDPNAPETFAASRLDWSTSRSAVATQHLAFVRELLQIRKREIVPRLDENLTGGTFEVADDRALRVRWQLADASELTVAANPTATPAAGMDWPLPGRRLFAYPALPSGPRITALPPWSVVWSLR